MDTRIKSLYMVLLGYKSIGGLRKWSARELYGEDWLSWFEQIGLEVL